MRPPGGRPPNHRGSPGAPLTRPGSGHSNDGGAPGEPRWFGGLPPDGLMPQHQSQQGWRGRVGRDRDSRPAVEVATGGSRRGTPECLLE